MTEAEDRELLEAWRGGDERAGSALVRRHFVTLSRFFARRSDAPADLMQQTMLGCVRSRDRVPEDVSFRVYLLGIARRVLLHHYRARARKARPAALEEADARFPSAASPSRVLAQAEEQRLLLRAMRALPLELQLALELYYWEQLKFHEIAAVLEIPAGTVKSRMARARRLLRERIASLEASEALRRSTLDNFERWARSIRGRALARDEEPEDG